jgi:hypothetical protein
MGKIDITGLDYNMVLAYVVSRCSGEATLAERMGAAPGASDPFAPLEDIKPQLMKLVAELQQSGKPLDRQSIDLALTDRVTRTD